MVGNDCKLFKIVVNSWKQLDMDETDCKLMYLDGSCWNGWNWLEMAGNGWICLKMGGWKWLELAGNCWKLLEMAGFGLNLLEMAEHVWKWLEIDLNGKKNYGNVWI